MFYFLHTDGDAEFAIGSPHLRLMDFLAPRADEPVLLKNTRNCFTSTTLQARLVSLGVRRLAITGIQTEQCCETTARHASDSGFEVDYVTEATLTFAMTARDGRVYTPAEIRARTELVLSGRFARIATVEEALDHSAARLAA